MSNKRDTLTALAAAAAALWSIGLLATAMVPLVVAWPLLRNRDTRPATLIGLGLAGIGAARRKKLAA